MQLIINLDDPKEITKALEMLETISLPPKREPVASERCEFLPLTIENCEFSVRTNNVLRDWDITTVDQLLLKSEIDLYRMPGLGRKSIKEIKDFLAFHGTELAK